MEGIARHSYASSLCSQTSAICIRNNANVVNTCSSVPEQHTMLPRVDQQLTCNEINLQDAQALPDNWQTIPWRQQSQVLQSDLSNTKDWVDFMPISRVLTNIKYRVVQKQTTLNSTSKNTRKSATILWPINIPNFNDFLSSFIAKLGRKFVKVHQ